MTRSIVLLLTCGACLSAQTYDVVLANGRVLDPESGLDAVRSVGIQGRRIAAVSATPLRGKIVVDAEGLAIAPGFIDLHSHGQDDENYRYKAHDGVTSALELEIGVAGAAEWYRQREGKARIHFGASSGHVPARMLVMKDTGDFLPRDEAAHRAASPEETLSIIQQVRRGLEDGAVGVGFGIAYVPAAPREEILRLFRLAAEYKAPVFVHMRGEGVIAALQEVIANALITGAALHAVHITSVGGRNTATCLEMIEGARKRGLDITTEMYPYTASATRIESALFDGDWEKRTGNKYGDLQWVATGERLTAETFARYRKTGGAVISHTLPEEALRLGLAHPMVMIASDGRLAGGKGHPRSAGTFARVLGLYSRDRKMLPLMDAIRKMTLMPAQRLETSVPAMRNKGRLRPGADADITVFDPDTVLDKATFENAAQPSTGIRHVLVEGSFVLRDGKLLDGVYPGRAIRTR
ncbi:MAG: amidohydrolase family protein [Bryobacteraceae bacterium]|nr:amidohydrolase family protein [Bryobacteraceae bacterium]